MAKKVRISAPRPAPSFTPLFVAIDKFLPEEGIEVEMQYHVPEQPKKAAEGELDYVSSSIGRGRYMESSGLIFVAQHQARATSHTLMIRPDIGSADRIKKVVMAVEEKDGLTSELRSILKQHGVTLDETDIELFPVDGGHPDQFRALQEGIGDGAPVGSPWWLFLHKQGYINLGCEADYSPGMGANGLQVTREKMEKDPEEVAALVRAYIKAVRYCKENVDGTIDVMLRYTNEWGIDGEEIAREAYKWLAPYWSETIDPAMFDRLLNNAADKFDREVEPIDSVLEMRFYEETLRELAKQS